MAHHLQIRGLSCCMLGSQGRAVCYRCEMEQMAHRIIFLFRLLLFLIILVRGVAAEVAWALPPALCCALAPLC